MITLEYQVVQYDVSLFPIKIYDPDFIEIFREWLIRFLRSNFQLAVFLESITISFGFQHGLRLTKNPKIVMYYNALLDIMVPKESYGSASRRWPNSLTPQTKAIGFIEFLQQAYFGLRYGLQFMIIMFWMRTRDDISQILWDL